MITSIGHQHHEAVSDADRPRLETQFEAIIRFMGDYGWHSLDEISAGTGFGTGSVGSQLRNARVDGYQVEKRRRREGMGTWEYRISPRATSFEAAGLDLTLDTSENLFTIASIK